MPAFLAHYLTALPDPLFWQFWCMAPSFDSLSRYHTVSCGMSWKWIFLLYLFEGNVEFKCFFLNIYLSIAACLSFFRWNRRIFVWNIIDTMPAIPISSDPFLKFGESDLLYVSIMEQCFILSTYGTHESISNGFPTTCMCSHFFLVLIGLCIDIYRWHLWPLLLTWFNFNPNMDK